ncbi:unnamed protein product, partial [Allacma fusca]
RPLYSCLEDFIFTLKWLIKNNEKKKQIASMESELRGSSSSVKYRKSIKMRQVADTGRRDPRH